jgi:hypothetical protein
MNVLCYYHQNRAESFDTSDEEWRKNGPEGNTTIFLQHKALCLNRGHSGAQKHEQSFSVRRPEEIAPWSFE